jgi:predicted cupin superfamily sugar epimerase/mannose-6-phosphate isomerase-like protein (cupin superfamily)
MHATIWEMQFIFRHVRTDGIRINRNFQLILDGSASMTIKLALMGWLVLPGLAMAAGTAVADPPVPPGMAGKLVAYYHMTPVPKEGAWFSSSYASEDQIDGAALPPRFGGRAHAAGNAIVVVVTPRDFSAMHRLQSDEVWHFYGGSPLTLLLLYPDGHGRRVTLGSHVLAGEVPQLTVPHGVWQGCAPRDTSAWAYSFVGTQLSPGFDFADFEIGYRDDLQRQYPVFAKDIARLTRAEFVHGPAEASGNAESPGSRAAAFSVQDVAEVTVSPGFSLQELVGRLARDAKTSSLSIAKFTLAPGRTSGTSFNHRAKEVFVVTDGTGRVHLADRVIAVSRDSIVFIPAEVVHSIEADTSTLLSFYAISAPAFTPEDYVLVK